MITEMKSAFSKTYNLMPMLHFLIILVPIPFLVPQFQLQVRSVSKWIWRLRNPQSWYSDFIVILRRNLKPPLFQLVPRPWKHNSSMLYTKWPKQGQRKYSQGWNAMMAMEWFWSNHCVKSLKKPMFFVLSRQTRNHGFILSLIFRIFKTNTKKLYGTIFMYSKFIVD